MNKKAAVREYIVHTQEQRWAKRLVRQKMQDVAAFDKAYGAAFLRLRRSKPADAKAIDAYVVALWTLIGAQSEELYRECERRALAPAIGKSRAAANAARKKALASPVAVAKREALKLWPMRHWTAKTLWRVLGDQGHNVGLSTVQRWVTALRK